MSDTDADHNGEIPELYRHYAEALRGDINLRQLPSQPELVLSASRAPCLVAGVRDAEGNSFEVHVVSDIDGCLNIEDLPEAERWRTVGPAREAFASVQRHGVMVSLMSSRSLAEINLYRREADVHGFAIGEDGGALQLPEHFSPATIGALQAAGFRVESLGDMNVVNLSRIGIEDLRRVLVEVAVESGKPVISSLTSSAAELREASGHETLEHAEASMVRATSAYAKHLTAAQAELLHAKCETRGIRVMDCPWDSTHCLFGTTFTGVPVNKGDALLALNRIVAIAHKTAGMRPVVIGNGTNDLPLMRMAIELGGQAIVIPKPDGTYALPIDQVPGSALRAGKAAGEGIAQVLPWAILLAERNCSLDGGASRE